MNTESNKSSWWTPEFTLVFIMLIVLTVLVVLTLYSSMPPPGLNKNDPNYIEATRIYYATTLDYRRNTLAIILTAFGAWVGAGAAYFFGRENLRESAHSLLALHRQMTGQDKLQTLKVREIPPKPLDTILDEKATLSQIITTLNRDKERWFVPLRLADKFYVLSKELILSYIQSELNKQPDKAVKDLMVEINNRTAKEVMDVIDKDDKLKPLHNRFITTTMDSNAAAVNTNLQEAGVFLAIVKDESGKETHCFTTNDIRKALLKI